MLWTFYVGFSHLSMSMGHHSTTRPAISVISWRKAQCQAYLISFFFFLLGLSTDIGTQYTLYVSCSCGKNVKNKVKWNLDPESLIGASVQPNPRFLSFTVKEKRGGTTFFLFVLKHSIAISCFVRTETATYACSRLKSQWGAGLSRNCVWSTHAMHCFKNYVQHAKLTVLKVFQNEFILFLGFDWHRN